MKRFRTLRARFGLWTAGLFLLGLTVFGLWLYVSVARGLQAALDDSLALVASQVAAGLDVENNRLVFAEDFAAEPENVSLVARGFSVRILDAAGETLQTLGPAAQHLPPLAAGLAPLATIADDDGGLRLRTQPFEVSGEALAFIQVAHSMEEVRAALDRLRSSLLVSVPLLVVLVGLAGYFLAARALAAIDRITLTAREIAEGSRGLSARLDLPRTDDEVGRLGETFDAMLARLDEAFRRERQFTTDASHELRTPLAAMRTILDSIGSKRRTPEEYEQALGDLGGQAARLRSVAEGLLALARQEQAPPLAPVDLSTIVCDVAESWQPQAEAKGLSLECDVPPRLTVLGTGDDLLRLFVNLLDNAVKFTDRGSIRVTAEPPRDGRVAVTVADTGRGIPPEHLPHIFERFYRVDPARSAEGAGLGLALASAVAERHGGRIDVASEVGTGTRVTVTLPAAPLSRTS